MIPRKELTELLRGRLDQYMPQKRIEQLVSDILELETGWEEMNIPHRDMGYSSSVMCQDICWLASEIERGAVIKIYRKKILPAS